jgi:Tfp pilus assembly protein PilP
VSDIAVKDGVVQIRTPGNYIVQINGKVMDVTDENFMPVVWDGEDWVLDKSAFSDEDAYDRAMSIL